MYIEKAVKYFGITNNPREGGYIIPDGRMLDFSGKKEGGSPNRRDMDHRDIQQVLDSSGTDAMIEFMNLGNIRMDGNGRGVDMIKEPTEAQYKTLKFVFKFLLHMPFKIILVEFTKPNGRSTLEFGEFTNTKEAISYIKKYFNSGLNDLKESFNKNIEKRIKVRNRKKLLEGISLGELDEVYKLSKEIGINTFTELSDFLKRQKQGNESNLQTLKRYRNELGNDFKLAEDLNEQIENFGKEESKLHNIIEDYGLYDMDLIEEHNYVVLHGSSQNNIKTEIFDEEQKAKDYIETLDNNYIEIIKTTVTPYDTKEESIYLKDN